MKIKLTVNHPLAQKTAEDSFTVQFFRETLKKEVLPKLHRLIQNTKRERECVL